MRKKVLNRVAFSIVSAYAVILCSWWMHGVLNRVMANEAMASLASLTGGTPADGDVSVYAWLRTPIVFVDDFEKEIIDLPTLNQPWRGLDKQVLFQIGVWTLESIATITAIIIVAFLGHFSIHCLRRSETTSVWMSAFRSSVVSVFLHICETCFRRCANRLPGCVVRHAQSRLDRHGIRF